MGKFLGEVVRADIYIASDAHAGHAPLYTDLVGRARSSGILGATVVAGVEGSSAASHSRHRHPLRIHQSLPAIVILIDEPDRVDRFLDEVTPSITNGLVTRRRAGAAFLRYGTEGIDRPTFIPAQAREWRTASFSLFDPPPAGATMNHSGPAKRLTIYIDEGDRSGHRPLAQAIVERAREEGMDGATVLRGVEGFGTATRIHTARLVDASEELPIIIELIDEADRLEAFLPIVEDMVTEGLITLEGLEVSLHRRGAKPVLDDEQPQD